jgi:DNA-binding NarL/FixJ family response regulator
VTIRVVLADDHPIVLEGLAALFRLEPDFDLVATCRDGTEALAAVREHRPDLLILDLNMPRMDGMTVVRALRSEGSGTRVVVLTAFFQDAEVVEAVRLGVRGLIVKDAAPRLLMQCARRVASGGDCLDSQAVATALARTVQRDQKISEMARVLTEREIDVARLVAAGLRNKEIARRLAISEGTVKVHLHHIYEKLGVDGRLALSLVVRAQGLA